jgi:hypothetical protein
MISIQVVPSQGVDAYKLLRDKVTHEAATWYWANKAKSRLRHNNVKKGYIEVASAEGILVAQSIPKSRKTSSICRRSLLGVSSVGSTTNS